MQAFDEHYFYYFAYFIALYESGREWLPTWSPVAGAIFMNEFAS